MARSFAAPASRIFTSTRPTAMAAREMLVNAPSRTAPRPPLEGRPLHHRRSIGANARPIRPNGYAPAVLEVRKTEVYAKWLDGLRDVRARARVLVRVERLAAGNPGDARPVGEGVSELRVDYGPGYRVYFTRQGRTVVVLLAGGDKRTRSRDIATALRLARNL